MSAAAALPRYRPISVDVSKLSREEWLALRSKTIGASDMATIMGLNPYASELRLFLEKTGQIEPESMNEAMEIGLAAEPLLAHLYRMRTGRKVQQVRQMLYHPDFPFLHANLDRRVVGDDRRPVELKMVGYWVAADEFGDPGSDEVPMRHLIQVQQQMGIIGAEIADIAVLKGGNDFDVYTVPFDRDIWDAIVDAGREFTRRIAENDPPPPRDADDVLLRFPRSIAKPIEATSEIAIIADDLADAKTAIKDLEDQVDSLRMQVTEYMGECDTLTYLDSTLITWKSPKPGTTFDANRHAVEHPECHAQYTKKKAPSRTLLIKEAGSK